MAVVSGQDHPSLLLPNSPRWVEGLSSPNGPLLRADYHPRVQCWAAAYCLAWYLGQDMTEMWKPWWWPFHVVLKRSAWKISSSLSASIWCSWPQKLQLQAFVFFPENLPMLAAGFWMSWHFANSEATWDRCLRPIGMSVACCYWHLREPPFIATKLMDCGPARTAWAVMFLMAVVFLLCFFEFAAVLFWCGVGVWASTW